MSVRRGLLRRFGLGLLFWLPGLVLMVLSLASAQAAEPSANLGACARDTLQRVVSRTDTRNSQVGGVLVQQVVDGKRVDTDFFRTDRSITYFWEETRGTEAAEFYEYKALDGKTILDAGSGTKSDFVADLVQPSRTAIGKRDRERLEKLKIRAFGVDILPNLQTWPKQRVARADVVHLPFPDATFDHVYSHFNIFWGFYMTPDMKPIRLAALKEFKRVLKPNGTVRIANLEPVDVAKIEKALEETGGFRLRLIKTGKVFYAELIREP